MRNGNCNNDGGVGMIDRLDLPHVMPKAKIRRTKAEHLAAILKRRAAKKAVAVAQASGPRPQARAKRKPGRPRIHPPKAERVPRKPAVADVDFIEAWNRGGCAAARALTGKSEWAVRRRARALREAGQDLTDWNVSRISDEQYARLWNEAPNLEAVVVMTGYTPASATSRAGSLRARGFDLKYMPHPYGRPARMSDEEFLSHFNASVDIDDAVRRTGYSRGTVIRRSSNLRTSHHFVKRFRAPRRASKGKA